MLNRFAGIFLTALALSACGSTRTAFLPLDYPNPDQAMIAVVQHIAVDDARQDQDIRLRIGSRWQVLKPVPPIDEFIRVSLGRALLTQYPSFAESLTRSQVLIRVRIDDIADTSGPGAQNVPQLRFRVALSGSYANEPAVRVWSLPCPGCSTDDVELLVDQMEAQLLTITELLAREIVKDAAPHMPPPPSGPSPRSLTS